METQSVLKMLKIFFLHTAYHLKNLNAVDCLLAGPTDSQPESTTHTNCCIQGVPGGICNTLGNDSMCDSKQKSSYEHGSDFEQLPRLW